MTATIIQFPDMHERNDREFEETGSTPFSRAVEEAHALGNLINQRLPNKAALLKRVDALEVETIGLAAWREEVDGIISIELLSGVWATTTLRDAPKFFRDRLSRPVHSGASLRAMLDLAMDGGCEDMREKAKAWLDEQFDGFERDGAA